MVLSIIIASITCITLILSILFFPRIKIGRIGIGTYWIVALIGATLMIVTARVSLSSVFSGLTSSDAINPLKILCLFISMTILSIFLDEVGFFKHMANIVCKKAGSNQIKLFLYLYILTSILTIFTSNDIIILTFTPFICYFAKNTKINPIPYLVGEFIAANTWSMMLVIGNPTNIYIAQSFNINFLSYLKVMVLPTIVAGVTASIILLLIFHKDLKEPISECSYEEVRENKFLLITGLIHLGLCTILLAISSYIGLEMWYITLAFAMSLLLIISIYKIIHHEKDTEVEETIIRAPWTLIPFVLSMFVIVLALKENDVTNQLGHLLGNSGYEIKYGLSSFVCANIINNIPMSLFFTEILKGLEAVSTGAIFATIIGSNIGAFLTPIGALAGIMWMSILKKQNVKMSFLDFTKYGIIVGVPTILLALVMLIIVL